MLYVACICPDFADRWFNFWFHQHYGEIAYLNLAQFVYFNSIPSRCVGTKPRPKYMENLLQIAPHPVFLNINWEIPKPKTAPIDILFPLCNTIS